MSNRRMPPNQCPCDECVLDRIQDHLAELLAELDWYEFDDCEDAGRFWEEDALKKAVEGYINSHSYQLGLESDEDKKEFLLSAQEKSVEQGKKQARMRLRGLRNQIRSTFQHRQRVYVRLYGEDERYSESMLEVNIEDREEIYEKSVLNEAAYVINSMW